MRNKEEKEIQNNNLICWSTPEIKELNVLNTQTGQPGGDTDGPYGFTGFS